MNIVIPAKTVAFLRNSMAILGTIILSYIFGTGGGSYLYFVALMVLLFVSSFLLAMVVTKHEVVLGFIFAALCTGFHVVFRNDLSDHSHMLSWVNYLGLFSMSFIFCSLGTQPVYLWRRWRRKQEEQIELAAQRLEVIEEIEAGIWPPSIEEK